MPTLLLIHGLRFFFYSNESNEPIHVHIVKGDAFGKIWLEPILQVAYLRGFTSGEEKLILETASVHAELFKSKWNEYFGK